MVAISDKVLKEVAEQHVYYEGTLAFYDTFSGLVPCKVLEVKSSCYGFRCGPYDTLRIKVTEDHGPYKKDEILTVGAASVPPRKMVRRYSYSSRIITTYMYKPKE